MDQGKTLIDYLTLNTPYFVPAIVKQNEKNLRKVGKTYFNQQVQNFVSESGIIIRQAKFIHTQVIFPGSFWQNQFFSDYDDAMIAYTSFKELHLDNETISRLDYAIDIDADINKFYVEGKGGRSVRDYFLDGHLTGRTYGARDTDSCHLRIYRKDFQGDSAKFQAMQRSGVVGTRLEWELHRGILKEHELNNLKDLLLKLKGDDQKLLEICQSHKRVYFNGECLKTIPTFKRKQRPPKYNLALIKQAIGCLNTFSLTFGIDIPEIKTLTSKLENYENN